MKTTVIKVLRKMLAEAQGRVRLIEAALSTFEGWDKPKQRSRKRRIGARGRRNIVLAQKKRWRKWHKEQKR